VFGYSFVISFGAVVSPGPVTAAVITEAPRQGWRVGPLVVAGHALLEFLMVLLISIGLAAALDSEPVRIGIALVGGLVLLLIGAGYLYGAWRGTLRLPAAQEDAPLRSAAGLFGLGLLTTLSNPFWFAWWISVAAGYLMQAKALGPAAVAAFYLGHESADLSWNLVLSTATSAGRRWLTPRRYKALILLTGGVMIYFGVLFLRSAFLAGGA
jgi:threonine/homoserine/homoserine lactone efflux protein